MLWSLIFALAAALVCFVYRERRATRAAEDAERAVEHATREAAFASLLYQLGNFIAAATSSSVPAVRERAGAMKLVSASAAIDWLKTLPEVPEVDVGARWRELQYAEMAPPAGVVETLGRREDVDELCVRARRLEIASPTRGTRAGAVRQSLCTRACCACLSRSAVFGGARRRRRQSASFTRHRWRSVHCAPILC